MPPTQHRKLLKRANELYDEVQSLKVVRGALTIGIGLALASGVVLGNHDWSGRSETDSLRDCLATTNAGMLEWKKYSPYTVQDSWGAPYKGARWRWCEKEREALWGPPAKPKKHRIGDSTLFEK